MTRSQIDQNELRHLDLIVKIADSKDEFDQIHSLNYATFVKEIHQHEANPAEKLIDPYHECNTYFIAKRENRVVGMICITVDEGKGFSVEKKMADPSRLNKYRAKAIEIRLLSVVKKERNMRVFRLLFKALGEYALAKGWKYALISGLAENEKIYRRIGFEPIAPAAPSGDAIYIPMVLSRDKYMNFLGKG
jgi:predicted N-acetyltransferase YhbS